MGGGRLVAVMAAFVSVATPNVVRAGADAAPLIRLQTYEQQIVAHPEDLGLVAEYRQAAIAAGMFDRPIDFLRKLSKQKGSGPNISISYALACVDKIPIAGDVRRAYIGFDAMDALTRAIAQQPSVLAYYVRGRINLGYDKLIFHRADKGAADLTRALALVTDDTPPALSALVFLSLGDAYYKLDNAQKARETWTAGAARFPNDPELRNRLATAGVELRNMVNHALSPGTRADTSLVGVVTER